MLKWFRGMPEPDTDARAFASSDPISHGVAKHALPPNSWQRKLFLRASYVVYLAALIWAGDKLFWQLLLRGNTAHSETTHDVYRVFYPELWTSGVIADSISASDQSFDVLMLGGSVLEQVADEFEAGLRERMQRPVRVYQLARSAHTSRDSLLKFQKLHDKDFDLVVVYHGINDVRMNCCPAAEFRDDYSHCHWYRSLRLHREEKSLSLPSVLHDQLTNLISLGEPDSENLKYGGTIKTAVAFRSNIEAIVREATARNASVCLMTFAHFIPDDYSKSKFLRGTLEYQTGEFAIPAETWGYPWNVTATLDAHNAEIRDLVVREPAVIFIDQQKLIPRNGQHFSDPCHLTAAGCRAFADNMLGEILTRIDDDNR